DFSCLPIVSDALQDAGCEVESILAPFRGGTWRPPGQWVLHEWEKAYHTGEFYDDEKTVPQKDYTRLFLDPLHIGRDYDLYAILANVRNGRGFGGMDTGDGFIPIADPRGLPPDVTPQVAAESDRWEGAGHSHSYFTVAEMLAYDWTQSTSHRGWVTAAEYTEFKEKGKPSSWSGGVSGSIIEHLSNGEMEERIKQRTADNCYTRVEWRETYSASVGSFMTETLPAMKTLGHPDLVRLVFF